MHLTDGQHDLLEDDLSDLKIQDLPVLLEQIEEVLNGTPRKVLHDDEGVAILSKRVKYLTHMPPRTLLFLECLNENVEILLIDHSDHLDGHNAS